MARDETLRRLPPDSTGRRHPTIELLTFGGDAQSDFDLAGPWLNIGLPGDRAAMGGQHMIVPIWHAASRAAWPTPGSTAASGNSARWCRDARVHRR